MRDTSPGAAPRDPHPWGQAKVRARPAFLRVLCGALASPEDRALLKSRLPGPTQTPNLGARPRHLRFQPTTHMIDLLLPSTGITSPVELPLYKNEVHASWSERTSETIKKASMGAGGHEEPQWGARWFWTGSSSWEAEGRPQPQPPGERHKTSTSANSAHPGKQHSFTGCRGPQSCDGYAHVNLQQRAGSGSMGGEEMPPTA